MKRVCVVGGGITGLAAAWRVQERAPGAEIVILEASGRLGGKIETVRREGCILEAGAWWLDCAAMLPLSPWLRQDLDLGDQIIPAAPLKSYIFRRGELQPRHSSSPFPFPVDPESIIACGALSDAGTKRAVGETDVPPADDEDETVGAFFERRFGAEYVAALLSPWFHSVFMAPPFAFSMRAVFPQLITIERRFKSLAKARDKVVKLGRFIPTAALAQIAPPKILKSWLSRDPLSRQGSPRIALRYGLGEIVASLTERLRHTVSLNEAAERLVKTDRGWLVVTAHRRVYCDTAVLAAPIHVAGKLLSAEFPDIAGRIASTKVRSGAIVNVVIDKKARSTDELRGKEILMPCEEDGILRSVQCVSDRFPVWAADECAVIRIVAGSMPAPLAGEEAILGSCLDEIKTRLGVDLKPSARHVQVFPNAYPVYGPGHCELVEGIRHHTSPGSGLCVCGDGLIAGGIPGVIQDVFEQIDSCIS